MKKSNEWQTMNGKTWRNGLAKSFELFDPFKYSTNLGTFTMKSHKEITTYATLPLAFDIETTSTIIDGKETAWCYHWQLGIGDDVYFGRYLEDAKTLFDKIASVLSHYVEKIICLVHNFPYEFGFLTEVMNFTEIFATAKNKPIKATYRDHIEFRCSYAMTNLSLAKLSEQTTTKKAVGDLDYRIVRYPCTPLTDEELGYCYADVKILTEYWKDIIVPQYIKKHKIVWLPITNTSKVRKALKDKIQNKLAWKKLVEKNSPDDKMYSIFRRCFYGGLVRANADYCGIELSDVASRDRTSSYPAVMLQYLYPMSKFRQINMNELDKYYNNDEYAKIYHVVFKDLKCKAPVSLISSDKTKIVKLDNDAVLDNGRIYSASYMECYVTDVDFKCWCKTYDGQLKIEECWISKKGRLPRFIIETLVELYTKKKTLKGVKGKEDEYNHAKGMFNSLYGCCVTKANDEEWTYDNYLKEWKSKKTFDNSTFLLYQWGVYIAAYARMELVDIVIKIWQDDIKNKRKESSIVYMDTDSCKYRYRDGALEYIFDENDKRIIKMTEDACTKYECDFNIVGDLGTWDLETLDKKTGTKTYKSFITLGAKRYLHDGEPTISGLPKKGFERYCKDNNCTPQEAFKTGTEFTPDQCEKTCMKYFTNRKQFLITMPNGEVFETPKNYIYASNVGFKLDISKDYKKFTMQRLAEVGKRGMTYED